MAKISSAIRGISIRRERPLTNDELRAYVPSVFSEVAHESRSNRFTPVSTIQVIDKLRDEGFFPFFAVQTSVRDDSRKEFTKHMLRLRKHDAISTDAVDEIILLNANDGTSSYQMTAGQFRFVCANGLVHGDINNDIRVHHKGNIIDGIIEGVYSVVNTFDEIKENKLEMQSVMLSPQERKALAVSGYIYKHGMPDNPSDIAYNPEILLNNRRYADAGMDLFSTFNVVQENLIRGGQQSYKRNGSRYTTRAINNITKDLTVNRGLWHVAKSMAQHAKEATDILEVL